jgi:hypothetical protein
MFAKIGADTVFLASGNGDANQGFPYNTTNASPDQISTSSFNRARGCLFRLPRALAVTDAYIMGGSSGSTGSMWKVCIYKASDNSQVWASSAFDTVGNDWTNLTGLSFNLAADTDYWMFVLATASGASTTIRNFGNIGTGNYYNSNSPLGASTGQGYIAFKEYTVATPGTLDATMPALSVTASVSGMAIPLFLKGTAS